MPPPTTRGRRSSVVGAVVVYATVGIILIAVGLLAGEDSRETIGTAVAGVALLAIAGLAVTGVLGLVTSAVLAFLGGILMTIVAFSGTGFGLPEVMLLVAGAATFISSFASLAAARRPGSEDEEPAASVEGL